MVGGDEAAIDEYGSRVSQPLSHSWQRKERGDFIVDGKVVMNGLWLGW